MSTPTIGNASRRTIAPCGDYSQAQQIVDSLADRRFPVEIVAIVGSDLRPVEQVIGRLATARAAPAVAVRGLERKRCRFTLTRDSHLTATISRRSHI